MKNSKNPYIRNSTPQTSDSQYLTSNSQEELILKELREKYSLSLLTIILRINFFEQREYFYLIETNKEYLLWNNGLVLFEGSSIHQATQILTKHFTDRINIQNWALFKDSVEF